MTRSRFGQCVLMMLSLSASAAAQPAPELYRQARVQELATGHLDEAIALYRQAARAADTDRGLAARALVRAAGCYEKLGRQHDAENLYDAVVRTYPEQRAEISLAQERLHALRRQSGAGVSKPRANARPSASTGSVLERYCVQCHNARTKSGDVDLASLNDQSVSENTGVWEQVVRRLRARRDPPAGMPRPDDQTYRAVATSLEQSLDDAYAADHTLEATERADHAEVAERVARLIWNAAPDAPLLEDAKRGRLHDPAVLRGHVARMLRDPRAASLVDSFFSAWLPLDNVKKARPDPSMYPDVDVDLLQAMETETRLFLESQLRSDRDPLEIWTANYTYVNGRLARHYGLTGVSGQEFRRVTWPDDRRAGILGQSSMLMALSTPSRTSPTGRGRFLLSRFFGVDPPTPPANVPALMERPASSGTMRDRLSAHKVNPSCASCHAMFDPLGLALENFDAVGAWRTTDGGLPIDASGTFIDGTPFDGPARLRAMLLTHRDAYYSSLTQRLLAYALHRTAKGGRVYDYEMAAVRKIVRDTASSGSRWSSLLAGVAASTPFQMKHIVP